MQPQCRAVSAARARPGNPGLDCRIQTTRSQEGQPWNPPQT